MAINSPFKGRGHSRNSSTVTVGSTSSTSMTALAAQYEQDKNKLIKYCFSRHDEHGNIQDSYITHVRVTEYEDYPSQKPPSKAVSPKKKSRVLALAVKKDGTVFLHKGRECNNGSFQIGRSWCLEELSLIKRETTSDIGFLARLGKDYYWETNSFKERQVFVTSLVRIYRKFKNGLVPQLINWDYSLFGLDEQSYKIFLNKDILAASSSPSRNRKSSTVDATIPSVSKTSSNEIPSSERISQNPRQSSSSQLKEAALAQPIYQQSSKSESKNSVPTSTSSKTSPSKRMSAASYSKPAVVATTAAATGIAIASAAAASTSPVKQRQQSSSSSEKPPLEHRKSLDPRNSFTPTVYVDSETSPKIEAAQLDDIQQQITNLTDNSTDSLVETGPPVSENDESNPSIPLTATVSLKDIEIVGHRQSMSEFQKEQEQEDSEDITELYFTEDTPEPLPIPTNQKTVYSLNEDPNESQDFSFDQTYDSQERVIATPGTIKAHALSHDESDNDYDKIDEDIPKLEIRPRVNTLDSFGFDAATLPQTINDSSVVGIFDDLQWDVNDDADTLIKKLSNELTNTQYNVVKNVVEIKQKANTLQQYTTSAINGCDKITPILSFFQIELAGFAKSIQHVEAANEGIQVETMNKKNLWNQLQTILNTVSVDEDSLKLLLSSDIDYDISVIERILADLQSAILEINGTANQDSIDGDLGEMRALKDRRNKYETVIVQFLHKIVDDLDARFKATFGELLAKRDFQVSHISTSLSKLLTYSTLILFAKGMSDETFDKLIGIWEGSANSFYEQILRSLNNSVIYSSGQTDRFTLASTTAFKDRPISAESKTKIDHQQEKLKMKLGMLEDGQTEVSSTIFENPATKLIFNTFETLQKHLVFQQNFILNFFHISNDDMLVKEYILKYPLKKRFGFLSSEPDEIETDRENARELYQSISSIFEPEFDALMKAVVQALRHNQKNAPTVILYLELFEKKFRSSNQEFLLNSFKVVSDRLKADWLRFLDIELKTIEKTTLAAKKVREVSIYIKNFANLVDDVETNYDQTLKLFPNDDKREMETRELINNSYEQLSTVIIKNLQSGEDLKSSIFSIQEININKEKRNRLINLIQNCNWLVESVSVSKVPQLTKCITTSKSIYNISRDKYVLGLANEYFGKIAIFVNDVQSLVDELSAKGVDPSKRNAYTKDILVKLLAGYNAREINKMVLQVRQIVVKHFMDEKNSAIQRQLIEKIWSAVQAQFVSTTLGLENIVSRYYRDLELQFSKKDVIAAFNNARL